MNLQTWIEQVQGRLEKATPDADLLKYQEACGHCCDACERTATAPGGAMAFVAGWNAAHAPTDLTKALSVIGKMREGLELLADKMPGCSCMDGPNIARQALAAADEISGGE